MTPIKKWSINLNRHLSKEDIQMANRYKKKYYTSLIVRDIQIKTTMRCSLILIRPASIKKREDNKYHQGYGEKWNTYLLLGM